MSPPRRTPYKARRSRREVVVAGLASGGLVVFTAVMVWVLGPHHSSSNQTPSTPPLTVSPSPSSTPGSGTPASSTPASSAATPST